LVGGERGELLGKAQMWKSCGGGRAELLIRKVPLNLEKLK